MTGEHQLKEKVAKGLLWGGLNNGSLQILNLIIGIFLARLLTPADYGMVGVLAVFSAIAAVLQEGGFISALTNRRNADEKDYNAVFWFSTLCGVFFYIVLFIASPLIADFYGIPQLTALARFIFIGFLISSLNVAPRAVLYKNMRVKEMSVASIVSLSLSGFTGIYLAYNGWSYWGLAWQQVIYILSSTIFTYYFAGWYPKLNFSFRPIKEMIGYSSLLVVTNVFNILNNNIFSILLGRFYSAADVGDYTQANKWNTMATYTISGMLHGVTQPSFARTSDDIYRQVNIMRKLVRFTAFITFPALLGLSFIAHDFIIITITDKWNDSAYILSILCLGGIAAPFFNIFSNLVLSQGKSAAYMWCTIALALSQMLAVYLSYRFGLITMLWIYISINILWIYVWHFIASKIIPLKFIHFLCDIAPYLITAAGAIVITYFICQSIETVLLSLLVKITLVATIYFVILWIGGSVILKETVGFITNKFRAHHS